MGWVPRVQGDGGAQLCVGINFSFQSSRQEVEQKSTLFSDPPVYLEGSVVRLLTPLTPTSPPHGGDQGQGCVRDMYVLFSCSLL